jgi:uncharacterized protein
MLLGAVTAIATLILTLIFLRWEKPRPADIGTAFRSQSILRLALGFATGTLIVALESFLIVLICHVRWRRTPDVNRSQVLLALLAYLFLATREELAFRGYPLRRLDNYLGPWPAQLIIATAFALEHRLGGYSWSNALLGAFTGSILFGMAALATRGLAVPIGLHAAYNFGHWLIGQKEQPGLWQPVVPQADATQLAHAEMAVYVIVFGFAALAFWLWSHSSPTGTPRSPHPPSPGT